MTECETIRLEKSGSILSVKLHRPDQMNALNEAMIAALCQTFSDAALHTEIRVVVLTGSGQAFCAGADLKEVLDASAQATGLNSFLDKISTLFATIRSCSKPVIAGLNGLTMAGGLELMLSCDFVIASEAARIGDGHSNYGIFPGGGGAAILPTRINLANAKYLLFTGDLLTAARAQQIGLVQEVLPADSFDQRLRDLAKQLAEKSPLVLERMKKFANASLEMPQQTALDFELAILREHARSDDMREGLSAFKERRKPDFSGFKTSAEVAR